VTWGDSDGDRPRTHFWITLPDDQVVMLDARGEHEVHELAIIARIWGLPAEPRTLYKDQELPDM